MKKATKFISLILFISICFVSCDYVNYPIYTANIEYYNEYTKNDPIFLDEIPKEATIVSFSYYNYWNEDYDTYLELKFSSTSELESYVNSLISHMYDNYRIPSKTEYFYEAVNPYNQSYKELFSTFHIKITRVEGEKKKCTVYKVNSDMEYYWCFYGIISYSYEDLTVIQTNTYGKFYKNENHYTPKYLKRFGVSLTSGKDRVIDIPSGEL